MGGVQIYALFAKSGQKVSFWGSGPKKGQKVTPFLEGKKRSFPILKNVANKYEFWPSWQPLQKRGPFWGPKMDPFWRVRPGPGGPGDCTLQKWGDLVRTVSIFSRSKKGVLEIKRPESRALVFQCIYGRSALGAKSALCAVLTPLTTSARSAKTGSGAAQMPVGDGQG